MTRGERDVPMPGLLGQGLAGLYGIGSGWFHRVYDLGWRRAHRLSVRVISVGNLVAGGTGKTPAVIALAREFQRRGRRPAVLTRGYGGCERALLRDGEDVRSPGAAARFGDEPVLLALALPGIPVGVDPDRVRSGRTLLGDPDPPDVILLDDGFQHRRLARDADLVLLDAQHPLDNGRLLPAGRLRERPASLRRASHLLVTGADAESSPGTADRLIASVVPDRPVFHARTETVGVRSFSGHPTAVPAGERVHLVTGVARPERVLASARAAGMTVTGHSVFPDHHPFPDPTIAACEALARTEEASLLTTEKDAVRLEGRVNAPWGVLAVRLGVLEGIDRLAGSLLGENEDGETPPVSPSRSKP